MFGCHPEAPVNSEGIDLSSFTKLPDPSKTFKLELAEIRVPNMDARRLYWDFLMIQELALTLPDNSWEAQQGFRIGNDIINTVKRGDHQSILEARKVAQNMLGKLSDKLDVWQGGEDDTIIWAIGHCHIDTAWL